MAVIFSTIICNSFSIHNIIFVSAARVSVFKGSVSINRVVVQAEAQIEMPVFCLVCCSPNTCRNQSPLLKYYRQKSATFRPERLNHVLMVKIVIETIRFSYHKIRLEVISMVTELESTGVSGHKVCFRK